MTRTHIAGRRDDHYGQCYRCMTVRTRGQLHYIRSLRNLVCVECPRQCAVCGERESSSPAWRGLHAYGPTGHDWQA
jgi:hypothetical protein